MAATNSFLRIHLKVADSTGLSAEVTRDVQPHKVTMEFTSEPSGMTLILDGFEVTTPYTGVSWAKHILKLEAPHQDNMVFESWSDGNSRVHMVDVEEGGSTFHAVFREWQLNTLLVSDSTGITSDDGPIPIEGLEGIVVEQQSNGKLAVFNTMDNITVWESTPSSVVEDSYSTALQQDGNLITRRLSDNEVVWKSQNEGGKVDASCGSSFLAIEALAQTLGIYCGSEDNATGLWTIETGPVFAPTPSPTMAPTTMGPTTFTPPAASPVDPTVGGPGEGGSGAALSHGGVVLMVSFGFAAALANV